MYVAIQVVCFLHGLALRGLLHTVLIVCPGSVLFHWVREFHKWSPTLRIIVLHTAGTALSFKTRNQVLTEVKNTGGIILCTYEALRIGRQEMLAVPWSYVVLDEGHRIRNPDAEITLVCKRLQTPHRLIVTGSPIQNHLRELWSLFDFVYPGRLGTLPTFEDGNTIFLRVYKKGILMTSL